MLKIWVYGSSGDRTEIEAALTKYASEVQERSPSYGQGLEYKCRIAEDSEVLLLANDLEEIGGWISTERQVGFATGQESNVNIVVHPTADLASIGAGVLTNTSTYVTIAERVITDGNKYHLAKVMVPMTNAHWLEITLNSVVKKIYLARKEDTFFDFYLFNEITFDGNGSQKIELKAKAVDTAETVYGFFYGEEV